MNKLRDKNKNNNFAQKFIDLHKSQAFTLAMFVILANGLKCIASYMYNMDLFQKHRGGLNCIFCSSQSKAFQDFRAYR